MSDFFRRLALAFILGIGFLGALAQIAEADDYIIQQEQEQ